MDTWIPNGCELTYKARTDLRAAVRCILFVSGALLTAHPGEVRAQQSVAGNNELRTSTLEHVTVVGFAIRPEVVVLSPGVFNWQGATIWIDGMRQDDFGSAWGDTSSNEPQAPPPPPMKNPQPDCSVLKDNPVDVSNGMKHVSEVDFRSVSNPDLQLARYKNPQWKGVGIFGQGWISNLDVKIVSDVCNQVPGKPSCQISASSNSITFYTQQGGVKSFVGSNGFLGSSDGDRAYLTIINDGSSDNGKYLLHIRNSLSSPLIKFRRNGQIESIVSPDGNNVAYVYDSLNRLTQVTHASGRNIQLYWTANTPGAVTTIVAPNGASYSFEYYYDSSSSAKAPLLKKVNYPDGKGNIEYVHPGGVQAVNNLTQIKINGEILKKYTYHVDTTGTTTSGNINGTVASSSFADGTNLIQYFYFQDDPDDYRINRTESINGYGKKTTFLLQDSRLVETLGEASVHCSATASKATYTSDGMLETTTTESGVTTRYEYDAYRRKVRQIEAQGTPQQRTTTWQWDDSPNDLDLVRTGLIKKKTVEGFSSIAYEYANFDLTSSAAPPYYFYSSGLIASITTTDLTSSVNAPQTVALKYAFYPNGLVASITQDGPLPGAGDYKKMNYSSAGDLVSVENSLGQLKTFSGHNGFGQPSRIVDFGGEATEYEYDARGRVVVERQFPNGSPVETRYVYGASGLLDAKTHTDGSGIYYHYDTAQRLVQEDSTEPGGGYAVKRYTYDAMSNPIKIEVGRDN